jgi:hypothetical protein
MTEGPTNGNHVPMRAQLRAGQDAGTVLVDVTTAQACSLQCGKVGTLEPVEVLTYNSVLRTTTPYSGVCR